jgi:signal peptidase I
MSPTLEQGDCLVADAWRYRNRPPAAGEIVVFERIEYPGVMYVKRIVGVAGDQIEIRDSVLYRNGQPVVESYLHAPEPYRTHQRNFGPLLVEPGHVFLLGDYRDNSLDSRKWGPIAIDQLRGQAEYIWFSMANRTIKWSRISTTLLPRVTNADGPAGQ